MVEQRQQRPPDGRPQLQGELALGLGGEAGRHQADVQRPAEGRQRVDRALVVEAEDGEDPSGVLGADWGEKKRKSGERFGIREVETNWKWKRLFV